MIRRLLVSVVTGVAICVFSVCISSHATAQTNAAERTFAQPKTTVEKAMKQLQSAMSGHLPTLEGFALAGDRPLSQYQRGFFQCTTQVVATPDGGSRVRVNAKVTAWYAGTNATATHSGYQVLTSNGRLESDLLDELSDVLASNRDKSASTASSSSASEQKSLRTDEPTISAPVATKQGSFSASTPVLSASEMKASVSQASDPTTSSNAAESQTEAATLEQVLRNQAHPKNLVAVKKSGTPVVGSPSLTGKTLFLASAEDEFEMLDFNADWVHVRISGLSRGWIWRTNLEMPEGIPDVPPSIPRPMTAADLFQVSRQETAQFPGDWVALRGKNVMIVSVQKIRENDPQDGPAAKLEFAKSLLDQHYTELSRSQDLSGLVLIFDSSDGGMIAATLSTIQRWKSGTLTDAAMWHQCYFDPPETFTVSTAQNTGSSPQAQR